MWIKLVITCLIMKEQKYIVYCMSIMEKYMNIEIPLMHMLFEKKRKKSIIFGFGNVGTWLSPHANVCRYLMGSEEHAICPGSSNTGSSQPWVCTGNWYQDLWSTALLSHQSHVASLVCYSFLNIFPFNLSRTILVIWIMIVHRLSHLNI